MHPPRGTKAPRAVPAPHSRARGEQGGNMGPAPSLSHPQARLDRRLRRLAGLLILLSCNEPGAKAPDQANAPDPANAAPVGDGVETASRGNIGHAAALL